MTAKERLHHAIESDDRQRGGRGLSALAAASGDRLAWMLQHAPLDDEPLTLEDEHALAECEADAAAGRMISFEEIRHVLERDVP